MFLLQVSIRSKSSIFFLLNYTSCVFHATKFKKNGMKIVQSWCMFIKNEVSIKDVVYYGLIMKTILKSLIISLRGYLVRYPYEPIVNILIIIKDIIIRRKANQQQVKFNTRVTNIWKDFKVLLLNYAKCLTINPNFEYLFSNTLFDVSLRSMHTSKYTCNSFLCNL